jgi:hypothetical protein
MKVSFNYAMPITNRKVNFAGLNPSCCIAAENAEENEHTPFPTLGDSAEKNYPDAVKAERHAVGLDKLSADVDSGRRWYYWSIDTKKPLPVKIARKLNDVAGSEVRAFGFAGGMDNNMIKSWSKEARGVDSWHVDTKEGLQLLTDTLKDFYAKKRGKRADIINACFQNLVERAKKFKRV